MTRMDAFELTPGTPIVLYLHSPKEKVWGLLVSLTPAGVILHGLDLVTFDEWMRQEARGDERLIGLCTIFYPMARLERLERDDALGTLPSYAERFEREVGRSVFEVLGVRDRGERVSAPRRRGPNDRPGRPH
ncbi:MAG TPA: hypothetical protein VFQ51_18975 [Vicinamibacteria bacterium]|nr:hypothetical protein [Vicinamibacteria bacterium]